MRDARAPHAIHTPKWFMWRCSIWRLSAWPKNEATATAEHSTHPPPLRKAKAAHARPEASALLNQSYSAGIRATASSSSETSSTRTDLPCNDDT